MTAGPDSFIFQSLFTAETLYDHLPDKHSVTYDSLYHAVASRMDAGILPDQSCIVNTGRCCGFSNTGRKNWQKGPDTSRLTNEYLSSLYGYLATKEETDPGRLLLLSIEKPEFRGCYSKDYLNIRPHVFRYMLYHHESDFNMVGKSGIMEHLEEQGAINPWYNQDRVQLCISLSMHEIGSKRASIRGRHYEIQDCTRGLMIRALERCHRELSGDQPKANRQKKGEML